MFFEFFKQGFFHILDLNGADHILFLIAICAIYTYKDRRQLLVIITSFTIAHSITLFLAAQNLINIDPKIIEILIAATIVFTCIENLFIGYLHKFRAIITAVFGLIHGIGFSYLLQELFHGMNYSVWNTLLPFNIGLEIGQIMIVSITIFGIFLLSEKAKTPHKKINYFITLPLLCVAIFWLIKRIAE